MKTVGIIAEYNPFHNGHRYQIHKAKKDLDADFCVVIMSGDFTQRGTPSVCHKSLRAKAALLEGADLILEMPVFGTLSGAADFADCGVSSLSSSGITDILCFGSETGDLELLKAQEHLLHTETKEQQELIREGLRSGLTWPMAKERSLTMTGVDTAGISSPNNILAYEYLRAIRKYSSSMIPFSIQRNDPGFHSLEQSDGFASASAIRNAMEEGKKDFLLETLPSSFYTIWKENGSPMISVNDFTSLLYHQLLLSSQDSLADIAGMPEDLALKLYKARLSFSSFEELISHLKDRQITYARVNRCLTNLMLGITSEDTRLFRAENSTPWLRILGFRRSASPLLKKLKEEAQVPVIMKPAQASSILGEDTFSLFQKHLFTSELYRLIYEQKTGQSIKNEFTRPMIIL